MSNVDAATFVAAVKRQFDDPENMLTDSMVWVGGGVSLDGSAVVIYRPHQDGPVLGRRYLVAQFEAMFTPACTAEELADIVIANEITEPQERGVELPVDWADGLVPDGVTVEWVGATRV